MKKWLRKFFNLCEHRFYHASNIMTDDGPVEVLLCDKCRKAFYRKWPSND